MGIKDISGAIVDTAMKIHLKLAKEKVELLISLNLEHLRDGINRLVLYPSVYLCDPLW